MWRLPRYHRLFAALLGACLGAVAAQGLAQAPPANPLEAELQAQLASDPNDGGTWRMLGRVREQRHDVAGATQAFQRAVWLEPESAAAQFDYGRILLASHQSELAATHLHEAIDLAPDSSYAHEAGQLLAAARTAARPPRTSPAGPQDVPASELAEPERTPERTFFFQHEIGSLYNSDVELTPISRELPTSQRAAYQAYWAPGIEFDFWQGDCWGAGAVFDGYFTWNEGSFQQFNIQHYQSGVYLERLFSGEESDWVSRLQYDFAHDSFDGETFGTRNAITSSLARYVDGYTSTIYGTADYQNFRDDGDDPSESSLDGWTYTLGMSWEYELGDPLISLLRAGVEGQWADLTGTTYRYGGVFMYAEAEMPLLLGFLGVLRGGWGYRDYPDFEFTPSRNENILNAGAELRRLLWEGCYLSGTFNYDVFESENQDFDSDRYTAGISLVFEH